MHNVAVDDMCQVRRSKFLACVWAKLGRCRYRRKKQVTKETRRRIHSTTLSIFRLREGGSCCVRAYSIISILRHTHRVNFSRLYLPVSKCRYVPPRLTTRNILRRPGLELLISFPIVRSRPRESRVRVLRGDPRATDGLSLSYEQRECYRR